VVFYDIFGGPQQKMVKKSNPSEKEDKKEE